MNVHVDHAVGVRWNCPTGGRELACRDHAEPRMRHHLDACQLKKLPSCPGSARTVTRARRISGQSALGRDQRALHLFMKHLIIDVLRAGAPLCLASAGSCGSKGMWPGTSWIEPSGEGKTGTKANSGRDHTEPYFKGTGKRVHKIIHDRFHFMQRGS